MYLVTDLNMERSAQTRLTDCLDHGNAVIYEARKVEIHDANPPAKHAINLRTISNLQSPTPQYLCSIAF